MGPGCTRDDLKGTGIGTVANEDGRFLLLNVPAGTHTITAQRIGFRTATQTVTVTAGQASVVDFRLEETALELEEVVVTGTPGVSSRREIGNTVSTIKADAVEYAPAVDLTEVLNGQASGIQQMRNEGQVGGGSPRRGSPERASA